MRVSYGRRLGKRKLKKLLGAHTFNRLTEMPAAPKVGDIITTCEGLNRIITVINPDIRRVRNRAAIMDYEILVDSGMYHSLLSCCNWPALTKAEIEKDWAYWATPEGRKQVADDYGCPEWITVAEALANGEILFDERGVPTARYNELRT